MNVPKTKIYCFRSESSEIRQTPWKTFMQKPLESKLSEFLLRSLQIFFIILSVKFSFVKKEENSKKFWAARFPTTKY